MNLSSDSHISNYQRVTHGRGASAQRQSKKKEDSKIHGIILAKLTL